jgi:hypothetical protein
MCAPHMELRARGEKQITRVGTGQHSCGPIWKEDRFYSFTCAAPNMATKPAFGRLGMRP